MKLIVPVNVYLHRYYRAYAEVDENATDEEIRKAITEKIIENPEYELINDPDIEIEKGDIEWIQIDHEGEWTEDDEKEITEILSRKD